MGIKIPEGYEFLRPEHPAHDKVMACAPRILFEQYSNGFKPTEEQKKELFNKTRIEMIEVLYIIEPCHSQSYLTQNLHVIAHAQRSQLECEKMVEKIESENRRRVAAGKPVAEVIQVSGKAGRQVVKDFCVSNGMDEESLLGKVRDLPGIVDQILASKKSEDRNHKRIDLGTCGNNNSGRCKETGLAKPRCFEATQTDWGKRFMADLWDLSTGVFPEETKNLFNDMVRRKEFADGYTEAGRDGRIESAAVTASLTHDTNFVPTSAEYFGNHVDMWNEIKDHNYTKVISTSFYLVHTPTGRVYRIAFIIYGKKACGEYLRRKDRYKACIDAVSDLFTKTDVSVKEVGSHVFPNMTDAEESVNGKMLGSPHTQKMVFYSVPVGAIRKLVEEYPKLGSDVWYVIALVFCSQVSNCPQYFYWECTHLASNPCCLGGHVEDMTPFDFAIKFYHHVFEAANGGKKSWDYPVSQRFQPTTNVMPSEMQIINSLKSIGRLVHEFQLLDPEKVAFDRNFFHHMATGHLSQKCPSDTEVSLRNARNTGGVYGWGDLLAQHGVAVMALLQIIPPALAMHAELAQSTGTWRYLRDTYGFSDEDFLSDSTNLLEAISAKLQIPMAQAEEILCRLKQWMTGTLGLKKDWIPPKIPLHFVGHRPQKLPPKSRLSPNKKGKKRRRKKKEQVIEKEDHERETGSMMPLTMHPDGSVTELINLGLSLQALSDECKFGGSEYWECRFKKKNPSKRSKGGVKPLRLQNLFPIDKKCEKTICLPDPQAVVWNCAKEHGFVYGDAEYGLFLTQYGVDLYTHATLTVMVDMTTILHSKRLNLYKDCSSTPKATKAGKRNKLPKKVKRAHRQQVLGEAKLTQAQGVVLYSYGVRKPGCRSVVWPDPDFVLRRDYYSTESLHSMEKNGRRYFSCRKEAKQFASWYYVLHYPELLPRENMFAREIITPPSNINSIWNKDIKAIKVFPLWKKDRSRLPTAVTCSFALGGFGVYLCNDSGVPLTPLHVQEPASLGMIQVDGFKRPARYIGIEQTRGQGKNIEVQVRWMNFGSSWENLNSFLSMGTHWHLFKFAREKKLLNSPGWRRLQKWKAHCLPVNRVQGQRYFDTILQAKSDEVTLKQAYFMSLCLEEIQARFGCHQKKI